MTEVLESFQCSVCLKGGGKCMCSGCKGYFCMKHFDLHRKELGARFENDIVLPHDELLEKFNKVNENENTIEHLLEQIDRWETLALKKIHQVAELAREKILESCSQEKNNITQDFEIITKDIRNHLDDLNFDENDIVKLRQSLTDMELLLNERLELTTNKPILIIDEQIDWNRLLYVTIDNNRAITHSTSMIVQLNISWRPNSTIVAGGNGVGDKKNQLMQPLGLYVDDDQIIYIADSANHRIMAWKPGESTGQIVAGGNGEGSRSHQLSGPVDVIVDKQQNSLIISDYGNRRVVSWSCRGSGKGKTLISNTNCIGLAMDDRGYFYVVDTEKHQVKRYGMDDKEGTIVAGGNGQGNRLNQLSSPSRIIVDRDYSVYISDKNNHRVMKWEKGAKQGIIVAGHQGQGSGLAQLSHPLGILLDKLDSIYIADRGNNRIMRWPKDSSEGQVIAGGNGEGNKSDQLWWPIDISFDEYGSLYVTTYGNHRVQKFTIDSDS